jgi:hypothetical protein
MYRVTTSVRLSASVPARLPACLRWQLLLSPLDPAAAIVAVCQLHRSLQEQDKGCNEGKLLLLLCLSSVPFGCAGKLAEKHRWLICYERKILFRLKKQAEKYGL